jgi:rod shape-determining protein MreD
VLIRRVRLVLVVVTLVVLQTTVFPHLRIFGAAPDLLLVATAAMAYEEGPESGAVFGFASGLVLDLFLASPLGLSALSFALAGYLLGVFQGGMMREARSMAPILGFVGGLVGGTIFIVVGGIAGESGYFSLTSVRIIIVAALYDAVVAFAIFPFVRWANRDPDGDYRRARGYR